MKNLFTTTRWDARRRAWMPALNRVAFTLVVIYALTAIAAVTQLDLTKQVKGILPSANGGTGSAYFGVSGLTTLRTFTFPDANGTVMMTSTAVQASQLPNPGATTLGGVQSKDCTGTGHLLKINTDGTVTCSADAAGPNFADAETPSGTIDGSNATFTLAHTPTGTSLQLYKNGQQMIAGASADYTVSTATITFATGSKPASGDVLMAFYRY